MLWLPILGQRETASKGGIMNDRDEITETVFHYFEGYKTKDRARLERAFAVDVANLMGYWKNQDGELELFSQPMKELIEYIARTLVEYPDEVEVREGSRTGMFELLLAPDDVGRVIGRRGRTAKALRTVLRAGGDYDLDIVDPPEPDAE